MTHQTVESQAYAGLNVVHLERRTAHVLKHRGIVTDDIMYCRFAKYVTCSNRDTNANAST